MDDARVANLELNDAERFPVGTVVAAVPAASALNGLPAGAPAVESQTIDSDGTETFTTLVSGAPYALTAVVDGERRTTMVRHVSTFSPPLKWAAVVAARRAAMGTS